jgi:hypothetical protein
VCSSQEPYSIDRLLVLGGRGPRSLAPVFGLDRRDIARHERKCLTGQRRQRVEADLMAMVDGAVNDGEADGEATGGGA